VNLPDHLKAYLLDLRAEPRFHEVMKAVTRTVIKPYAPNTDVEKATTALIYASGRLAGEKSIMLEVLGYDPTDRQSE
jgi:hypothetical protein